MLLVWVRAVMTAATICFAAGLVVRRSNNALHRKLMMAGFVLTIGIAVVLVVGVNVFGESYGPADWLTALMGGEGPAGGVLIAHRIFATLTFLALLVQVLAGIRRLSYHRRLGAVVIPLWLVTYVSGLFIFS